MFLKVKNFLNAVKDTVEIIHSPRYKANFVKKREQLGGCIKAYCSSEASPTYNLHKFHLFEYKVLFFIILSHFSIMTVKPLLIQ